MTDSLAGQQKLTQHCKSTVCMCAGSLSHIRLSVTPWMEAVRLLCPWNFPSKNARAGYHFLLQKKKYLLAEMIREFYEVRDITMALKNAYVKQSKCPLVHETGKESVAYRYKGISFSLYKKETPFVTWMDLEDNTLTEVSQSQQGKYCVISLTYRI